MDFYLYHFLKEMYLERSKLLIKIGELQRELQQVNEQIESAEQKEPAVWNWCVTRIDANGNIIKEFG